MADIESSKLKGREVYHADVENMARAGAEKLDAADGKSDGIIHRATLEAALKKAEDLGAFRSNNAADFLESAKEKLQTLPEALKREDVAKGLARLLHTATDKLFDMAEEKGGSLVGQTATNSASPAKTVGHQAQVRE